MEYFDAILHVENKRRKDELKQLLAEMVVVLETREIIGSILEDRYCLDMEEYLVSGDNN
ncbi:hypothetical protein [Citrobacter sp. CtB7.12]|uniref:hypothetical protein n=1 Tax=Citrobacter sp. CtB7.12 TaxID=1696093 RepID=UPI000A8E091C|nr:hypothetical protein [Citrobacter sp. CtB7.12]